MKVAIDSGPLIGGDAVRGVGVYTSELISSLNEKTKKPVRQGLRLSSAGRPQGKLNIEAVDFKNKDLSKYDLLHFPYFQPFFLTLPLCKKNKWVVTIHDTIPLIYPEHYPPGLRGQIKFQIQRYLLGKVDSIICPSETSKKDVVRFLGVPAEKIQVIYEAPRKIFRKLEIGHWKLEIKKRYGLPERFVLYVGDVNYNKNIRGLADACKIAKISLVIVGKQAKEENFDKGHKENNPFSQFLVKYGEDSDILRLGFVPDDDLVPIYNLATIYCQPSFYEGFGLPVLEAFASGTPVVAARTQALVEIAANSALFADPRNPQDMAEKMSSLIGNAELRANFIRMGKERVKAFSWSKTAKETLSLYRQLRAS